jgi:geranylgeranyl diphosphate synthase type I
MEIFDRYLPLVKKNLSLLVNNLDSLFKKTGLKTVDTIKNSLLDFALSGKLIRGSLYLFAAESYGFSNLEKILKVASAIELVHSGLLIHDDIMDNDQLRRGKPTINNQYRSFGLKNKVINPDEFGKSMAICVGDICFFAAFKDIVEVDIDCTIKEKLINYFSKQIIYTGLGQMDDVYFGSIKNSPLQSQILTVYQYKTANYTFNLPLIMGYLTSGREERDEIVLLEKLGSYLGLIFQVTDDIIGLNQDEEVIGKDAGSDIREDKKTIVRDFILKNLKGEELDFAKSCFGNKNLSRADLVKLRQLFFERKINQKLSDLINDQSKKAREIVSRLSIIKENKNLLDNFLTYLVERIK